MYLFRLNLELLTRRLLNSLLLVLAMLSTSHYARGADPTVTSSAPAWETVAPLFVQLCYACHGEGADEGGLTLDALINARQLAQADADSRKTWLAVWTNLRGQAMPPADAEQPTEPQRQAMLRWIESDILKIDPANPDPGRVTIRRLNRLEYKSTIQDLLGVDFDVHEAFPADDTGYGFDTIGDVLSISPLLMEKYLDAAKQITARAIDTSGPRIPTVRIETRRFRSPADPTVSARDLPLVSPGTVQAEFDAKEAGRYRVTIEYRITGSDEATSHTATLNLLANDKRLAQQELGWDNRKVIRLTGDSELIAGRNTLSLEVIPRDPPQEREDALRLATQSVELLGPLDRRADEESPQYRRIFFEGKPPADEEARQAYATRIIEHFAERAFRRPVASETRDRLVALARTVEKQPGMNFEEGIAHALTAMLVSPRFLFRAETQPQPDDPKRSVEIDEFALASRLSYFLWSSLPDEALWELAQKNRLRAELEPQVTRMLADPKADRFLQSFVGQWLRTRDVETLPIDARRVLRLRTTEEAARLFNRRLRQAMREETELLFSHLVRTNGSALDLLTADYTFLNEPLAKFYGIEGVRGNDMRRVDVPADSHRGGLLTHASFLVVTSNPTRTSPVKRGLFILENLLGTPSPPPPPDVPELEVAGRGRRDGLTMRELLAVHREQPLCASCHDRMDPLGLAFENYNALGMWRDEERGQPIDASGKLLTGEAFAHVGELAQVLAASRRTQFYRCLTEKMLTYAIGRGVEYYDAPAIDQIIGKLDGDNGRLQTLVMGIIESVPFQQRRGDGERID